MTQRVLGPTGSGDAIKYFIAGSTTLNDLERAASGLPAAVSFTVQSD